MEWIITIEAVAEQDVLDESRWEDAVDDLVDLLPEVSVSYSSAEIEATFTISDAPPHPVDAIMSGFQLWADMAMKANLPALKVLHVAATTPEAFERHLESPNLPGLLGVSELADHLEVSKQRASELAHSTTFPQPAVTLASGPVWLETQVTRYVEEWERRPGRPANK